jgi:recombination protein RecA
MVKKNTDPKTAADTPTNGDKLKELVQSYLHPQDTKYIRTGIHAFDLLIGDGVPRGRTIEILGPEMVGKSLLFWTIARAWQQAGGIVVFSDAEAKTPKLYIERLGINTNELIYYIPNTVEELSDDMDETIPTIRNVSNAPILWGIDSIASLNSEAEYEDDKDGKQVLKDSQQPARVADSMSKFFRRKNKMFYKEDVTFVCVNQIREKIGVMFGKNTESPGGRALRHYASIRIEINKGKKYEVGADKDVRGQFAHFNIIKNQVAEPFRKAELLINFGGSGYDTYYGMEDVLLRSKRITVKDLKNYQYGETVFPKKDVAEFVANNPDLIKAWM